MAFPLVKLATLVINQISKPLANKVVQKAKTSPTFRKWVCLPPAKLYHFFEVRVSRVSKRLSPKTEVKIPTMDEEKAIELGAGLVGDATVFAVGSSIFLIEYFRRREKKHIHELQEGEQHRLLIQDVKQLYIEKARLEAKVDELQRLLKLYWNSQFEWHPKCVDEEAALPDHFHEPEHPPEQENAFYKAVHWLFQAWGYISSKIS